jgi:HSP20 family molecular chaperone IbpA
MSYIFIRPRFQCKRQEPEYSFEEFLFQQIQRKKQEEIALHRKKQENSVKFYSKANKEAYYSVFEFPFYLHKQNFQIQVKEDKLTLEYEYAENQRFSRQIQIPEDVETLEISAKFKKNSLTISFPRIFKEETIEIEFVKESSKELESKSQVFEIPQESMEGGTAPMLEEEFENVPEESQEEIVEEFIPEEPQEPYEELKQEESKNEEIKEESTVEPVYPPLPTLDEKFKIHHEVLRGLGFENKILLEELIEKHNGNIQAIVKEYISRN